MGQAEILGLVENNECLFSSEIVKLLRESDEPKQTVRKSLKQMRKYGEIGHILVESTEKEKSGDITTLDQMKKLRTYVPEIDKFFSDGGKVRRATFVYFKYGRFKTLFKIHNINCLCGDCKLSRGECVEEKDQLTRKKGTLFY